MDLANADMGQISPAEIIEIAGKVLEILVPLENWHGVARAYLARAIAHEQTGDLAAAERDRQEAAHYQAKFNPEENANG